MCCSAKPSDPISVSHWHLKISILHVSRPAERLPLVSKRRAARSPPKSGRACHPCRVTGSELVDTKLSQISFLIFWYPRPNAKSWQEFENTRRGTRRTPWPIIRGLSPCPWQGLPRMHLRDAAHLKGRAGGRLLQCVVLRNNRGRPAISKSNSV